MLRDFYEIPETSFKGTNLLIIFKTCLTSVHSFAVLCIQLKLQLSECQSQLDLAQKEAQAHKEELAQVISMVFNLLPQRPENISIYFIIFNYRESCL